MTTGRKGYHKKRREFIFKSGQPMTLPYLLNFLISNELPNTAVSLIIHPKAANVGVRIREFVKP